MRCNLPVDDVPKEPQQHPVECSPIKVCLPNCPSGYRQVEGSTDELRDGAACLPIDRSEGECRPINFQIVGPHMGTVLWRLRAEMSEACAATLLKTPVEPVREETLHGEGTAQFLVVVGEEGRVIDLRLLLARYTALPIHPDINADSSLVAAKLRQLTFESYRFRQKPTEFQTRITISFKPRNQVR